MEKLGMLAFALGALLALDFWTSRRAGLDGVKTGTVFAFPLFVAMLVGAFVGITIVAGPTP